MSLRNPYGDFELTDPQAMRALAHPVRLAALSWLQRHGSATATQLSEHVGASPSVTSWHLRHLANFGLVVDGPPPEGTDRRQRWWRAAARGFRVEMPDTPEGAEAMRLLGGQMLTQALDTAVRWQAETEPTLEPEWARIPGVSNTQVLITLAEAEQLTEELAAAVEQILAPYVRRRDEGETPDGARPVRYLRISLAEAME
ncbi:helix-turn-helix transcriptional regulator [Kribbella sandramycini]|uniref:DNA-binding transcriptional ArsR family regulator n=1 Tax=Kribbella sandramycini TaxID=60450 RepID=A0A7Y4KUA5_9ACTN|nr:ArsR family transcriptional regulator [Kribbella sandramycini]MBB6568738.1 DNA-binding transcriptional ArsR family regulator [Kribbella sandramycini]NOL38679.1 helix-turn-helix transcriptional regulator [Kribbella sandramycini]